MGLDGRGIDRLLNSAVDARTYSGVAGVPRVIGASRRRCWPPDLAAGGVTVSQEFPTRLACGLVGRLRVAPVLLCKHGAARVVRGRGGGRGSGAI
jgi:hypothetical protein